MREVIARFVWKLVLAGACAASGLCPAAAAPQSPARHGTGTPAAQARTVPNSVTNSRQAEILRHRWGIEDVHVRYTASGALVRFSWRVVNAQKAQVLNDKKVEPYMLVKKTGARLGVPEAERVGKLRQTAAPEEGREYWMAFTNAGRVLRPGDHVDIVIGVFRANELLVESVVAEPLPAPQVHKP